LLGAGADSCAVDGCRRHTAPLLRYIRVAARVGVTSRAWCSLRVMHRKRGKVNGMHVYENGNLMRREGSKEWIAVSIALQRLTYPTFVPPCDFKYLLLQFPTVSTDFVGSGCRFLRGRWLPAPHCPASALYPCCGACWCDVTDVMYIVRNA
jgi:hypothetical protein